MHMPIGFEVKQQERARITRERVLDAAAVEFAAHGFTGASVNKILAASGRTKGAFYFHFPSKDAIGRAVLDEARARYEAIARPWQGRTDDPVASLSGLIDDVTAELTIDPVLQAAIQLGIESEHIFDTAFRASQSWEIVALELAQVAYEKRILVKPFTPERLVRSLVTMIAGQYLIAHLMDSAAAVHAGYIEARSIVLTAMTIDAASRTPNAVLDS
jgi:AcrR family transcriptional regulator